MKAWKKTVMFVIIALLISGLLVTLLLLSKEMDSNNTDTFAGDIVYVAPLVLPYFVIHGVYNTVTYGSFLCNDRYVCTGGPQDSDARDILNPISFILQIAYVYALLRIKKIIAKFKSKEKFE